MYHFELAPNALGIPPFVMKMLLVYSLLPSLATATSVVTGGSCNIGDDHPENNGYHIVGVGGYKAITADEDPDDKSTYGAFGQLADNSLWTSDGTAVTYPAALPTLCAKGLREAKIFHTRS